MTPQEKRNQDALSTDHLKDRLGAKTVTGGLVALAAQPVRFVIQFVSTAIMARLLVPADFGLFAMAWSVLAFIGVFSNLGLGMATVQRETIDQNTVSGLFWLNLAFGAVLLPVTWALAPLAAWFFGDHRVVGLTVAMSFTLLFGALGAQHTAIMLRTMRYVPLQISGLIGHISGAIAGILAAWVFKLDYWALVVNAWAASIATQLFIWSSCRWRPSMVRDWSGAVSGLRFGATFTVANLIDYFHRQLDNLIIGWRFGPAELGIYSRAYQLMMLPIVLFNGNIASTVEPSLSRMQNEPERWRRAFLSALGLVTVLGAGAAALFIASAHPLIVIIYGPNWAESADVLRWLAISSFSGVPVAACNWIYMSLGRAKMMVIWMLVLTPVVGLSFLLAAPYGIVGIAAAFAIVTNLSLFPGFAIATYRTPVSFADTLKVVIPIGLAGGVAAWIGSMSIEPDATGLMALFVSITTTGLAYVGLTVPLLMFGGPFKDLKDKSLKAAWQVIGVVSQALGRARGRQTVEAKAPAPEAVDPQGESPSARI
ncbi:MAG: lipopolysaccharide biosynthesis protein [Alsobacter sp.]